MPATAALVEDDARSDYELTSWELEEQQRHARGRAAAVAEDRWRELDQQELEATNVLLQEEHQRAVAAATAAMRAGVESPGEGGMPVGSLPGESEWRPVQAEGSRYSGAAGDSIDEFGGFGEFTDSIDFGAAEAWANERDRQPQMSPQIGPKTSSTSPRLQLMVQPPLPGVSVARSPRGGVYGAAATSPISPAGLDSWRRTVADRRAGGLSHRDATSVRRHLAISIDTHIDTGTSRGELGTGIMAGCKSCSFVVPTGGAYQSAAGDRSKQLLPLCAL